jgi:hypothetical protein
LDEWRVDVSRFGGGEKARGQQDVVQFVGVAGVRARFLDNACDGCRVERCEVGVARLPGAPRIHRVRPPFLERRIVQKRIRPRVEQFVAQRRGLSCVACHARDLATVQPLENRG